MPRQKKKVTKHKSNQKHEDNLKLLFSDKEFNNYVMNVRKTLDIPRDGFFSDKEVEKWFARDYEITDQIVDENTPKLRKLKKSLDEDKITYKEYKEKVDEINLRIPTNYLSSELKNILLKFNLPANYKESIRSYIFYNIPIFKFLSPINFRRGTKEDRKENSVSITFYSKITDQDLKLAKKVVNGFFKNTLPKVSPLKDIDLKLKIKEYYDNRDVYNEGDDEYYRLDVKEIIENIKADTGRKVNPSDVYEVVRALNNLSNKRFKKKSGKK